MSCSIVSPSEVSARKKAAAIAELKRNGIQVKADLTPAYSNEALGTAATARAHEKAEAPIPPAKEFKSAPEAVEIPKAEIQNFVPLRPSDAKKVEGYIRLLRPEHDEDSWGDGWDDDDSRWNLTPHELRKLNRKHRVR